MQFILRDSESESLVLAITRAATCAADEELMGVEEQLIYCVDPEGINRTVKTREHAQRTYILLLEAL